MYLLAELVLVDVICVGHDLLLLFVSFGVVCDKLNDYAWKLGL